MTSERNGKKLAIYKIENLTRSFNHFNDLSVPS